ncbi:hypothetical protein VD659_16205 [Herbiconiux sp. 11R-BC]|uniref:hypothetical protein n=1 Tax=Herbiconiux sp. 11R-BC TaxID=3111637 RepID=UPI003C100849
MTSLRQQLADMLKPLLPGNYRYVTSERDPGVLSAPTVFIRQRRIEPDPRIVTGSHLVTFAVTIATPLSGVDEKAEDDLDEHTGTLLAALDALPYISWSTADKAVYTDTGISYDIALTIVTRKDA